MFETLSRYTVIENILRSPPFCQVSKRNIITNYQIKKDDDLYWKQIAMTLFRNKEDKMKKTEYKLKKI